MKSNLPKRRLIPKWRQTKATFATAEAAPKSPPSVGEAKAMKLAPDSFDAETFDGIVELWQTHREPGVLGDILSFSAFPDLQERILGIGRQALASGAPVTSSQRFVIAGLADPSTTEDDIENRLEGPPSNEVVMPYRGAIRRLRELLRTSPDDAIALMDYAQLQAAIGCNETAERSLLAARDLMPDSRIVLRSLARFYVHKGDYDQAHALIRRHTRTQRDPWLLASEIALADAAGTTSQFVGKARRLIVDSGKAAAASHTELAGSLAQIELASGNLKKAREYQRLALLAPNDNVIAQAVDRELQFGIALNTPAIARAIETSSEARVLRAWTAQEPEAVERYALQWHDEEPFSSRPMSLLTTMYAYGRQTDQALRWIRTGLRADPSDRGLMVNLAFVHACAGATEEAHQAISKARRAHGMKAEPFLRATEGLIAYRHGNFDDGDRLYGEAFEIFEKHFAANGNVTTYCLLSQAVAAIEHRHPGAHAIVARAIAAGKAKPSFDAKMMLKIVARSNAEVPKPDKTEAPAARLASQWVYDPAANTLTERPGLTAPGAQSIVVLKS